jgi:hypothetical protein
LETNNPLLSGIVNLHSGTPEYVISVGYGKKITDNQLTDTNSIVFGVEKKRPLSELIASGLYIVPEKITIDGIEYTTDVIETAIPTFLNCSNYNPSVQGNALPPEIYRHRVNTSPLKGGIVIKPGVASWRGTLGLICVDSETKSLVGLTNAHVAVYPEQFVFFNTGVYNSLYQSWRARQEISQFTEWSTPLNFAGQFTENSIGYVKKFSPAIDGWADFTDQVIRYHSIDAAVISLNECASVGRGDLPTRGLTPWNEKYKVIDFQESFKQLGLDYNQPMPFATTAEINSLIDVPRNVYSVGRSTGVKGYPGCRMRISNVFFTVWVRASDVLVGYFYDCIRYEPVDSQWIIFGGDSGSTLIADFDGVFKIIGLVFAGTNTASGFGIACRIDRVASQLGIEAWGGQEKYFANNNDIKIFVEDYSTLTGNFNKSIFDSDWPLKKTIPGSGDFWFMGLANIQDLTGVGIAGAKTYPFQDMNSYPISQSSLVQYESSCAKTDTIFSK